MNLDGEFLGVKKKEYNKKQYKYILETVEKLEVIKDKPLMMLGKYKVVKQSFL